MQSIARRICRAGCGQFQDSREPGNFRVWLSERNLSINWVTLFASDSQGNSNHNVVFTEIWFQDNFDLSKVSFSNMSSVQARVQVSVLPSVNIGWGHLQELALADRLCLHQQTGQHSKIWSAEASIAPALQRLNFRSFLLCFCRLNTWRLPNRTFWDGLNWNPQALSFLQNHGKQEW